MYTLNFQQLSFQNTTIEQRLKAKKMVRVGKLSSRRALLTRRIGHFQKGTCTANFNHALHRTSRWQRISRRVGCAMGGLRSGSG